MSNNSVEGIKQKIADKESAKKQNIEDIKRQLKELSLNQTNENRIEIMYKRFNLIKDLDIDKDLNIRTRKKIIPVLESKNREVMDFIKDYPDDLLLERIVKIRSENVIRSYSALLRYILKNIFAYNNFNSDGNQFDFKQYIPKFFYLKEKEFDDLFDEIKLEINEVKLEIDEGSFKKNCNEDLFMQKSVYEKLLKERNEVGKKLLEEKRKKLKR